jgi:hypothetical protein
VIELPAKFAAENARAQNTPAILVKLGGGVLENIQSSAGDWTANTAETNVDYASDPGSVVLEDQAYTDTISQTTNNASIELWHSVIGDPQESNYVRQSFLNTVPGTELLLESITIKVSTLSDGYGPSDPDGTNVIYMDIKNSALQTVATLSMLDANGATAHDLVFNFLSQEVKIPYNETYYFDLSALPSNFYYPHDHYVTLYYSSSGGYAGGFLDNYYQYPSGAPGNIGDAVFTLKFAGAYYPLTGSITTRIIDLGELPTGDGTWKIQTIKPSHYGVTNLVITAYGSTDNFSSSNVNLGVVTDGLAVALNKIYQYYKLTADFTTTSSLESPTLLSMGVSFVIFTKFSDRGELGFEPSLKGISSLTTQIDDFDLTTIGQITLTFGQTALISSFLATGYPKNKICLIKIGFIAVDFSEEDFIDFYSGVVTDWSYTAYDINIVIKDSSASWKVSIPRETSTAGNHVAPGYDSVIATADHPVDVMKDILYNHVLASESRVNTESFNTVEAALPNWKVTRTIPGSEQQDADSVLNELRVLIGAYFLFKNDGRVALKLYNSAETPVASLSHDDFLQRPGWESNIDALINKTLVWYDWNSGTEAYDHVYVGINATSQTNHAEVQEYQLEDKWTDGDSQGISQMSALATRILSRYANPPAIFKARLDRKRIALEVGDFVSITTNQAPSTDLSGQDNQTYQIIRRNFNPQRAFIDLTFLKVG